MDAGKKLLLGVKQALLLAATLLVVVGTITAWGKLLGVGFSGVFRLSEQGSLTFTGLLVSLVVVPAILFGLYIVALVLLYRRRAGPGQILAFALIGLPVLIEQIVTVVYFDNVFETLRDGRVSTFHDIFFALVLPALFLGLYVGGLVQLYLRQQSLTRVLAFAWVGLIVWFFYLAALAKEIPKTLP